MATKILQTRLALKYDTYANWTTGTGKDLVLLRGEIGICEIPASTGGVQTAPTVLFKVGNGTSPFKDLKWVSALAADVYNWAKAETVSLEGTTIKFKTGDTVVHSIDLSSFATDDEVETIRLGLDARLTALEGNFEGDTSVLGKINGLNTRLTTAEGKITTLTGDENTAGSVSKALKDAKDYVDTRETAITTAYEAYADQAETDAVASAKDYTDERESAINAKISAVDTKADNNAKAISNEVTARTNDVKAINDKIGGSYSAESTVADAIADAKKAGTDAAAAVSTLENGKVATNAENIGKNTQAINAETSARAAADKELSDRLDLIEPFFELAAGESLNGALDTLKEIQDYITSEGTAADNMVKDIAANKTAIGALQDIIKDGGTLEVRVDNTEAKLATAESDISALKSVTGGYSGANAIKTAVDAAKTQADKGVTDAKAAKDAADAAQKDVDDLAAAVNNEISGLAAVKTIADQNKADISALKTASNSHALASDLSALEGKVATAEADIDTLEGIVSTGNNANSKLRSDITALQNLTGDPSKGNEQLRTDLTTVSNAVNDPATGLAKTKKIADDALTKATAIESDYLKAADVYIFMCGSSTTNLHTAPAPAE